MAQIPSVNFNERTQIISTMVVVGSLWVIFCIIVPFAALISSEDGAQVRRATTTTTTRQRVITKAPTKTTTPKKTTTTMTTTTTTTTTTITTTKTTTATVTTTITTTTPTTAAAQETTTTAAATTTTPCVYNPNATAFGHTYWYFRFMERDDFYTVNERCEKRQDGAGWNYWRSADDPQPGEAFIVLDLGCSVNVSSVALKNVYNYEPDWQEITTENFRVLLSTDASYDKDGMTWTKVVEDTLVSVKAINGGCEPADATCCGALPGMTFQFEEQPARFAKFVVDSYIGNGAGLKYFVLS